MMRSLFLRIFLSFWAAMLLVLSATAAVAWYRFNQVQSVSIDTKALGNEAAARLLVGGLPALQDWIDEAEHRYRDRRIFIVDQSGEDLRKRKLPTTYRNYIQRLRDAGFLGKELVPSRRDDPLLLTPLFTDRDGTVYTIMVSPPIWSNLLFAPDVRLVLLASALLLSGLVCWSLARYLSKPVERLQSSARSLAAGNMEARVGEEFSRRRDELGVLARDFDTMADHVRALIASKENLLRAMSHELRSPLARLRVATDLARRPGADVSRQLDRIELEAERLDTLIGQILQLSHLRAVPTLPREPLDLTSLMNEIIEDARTGGRRGREIRRLVLARRGDDRRRRSRTAAQRDRECPAQRRAVHQAVVGGEGAGGSRGAASLDRHRRSRARRAGTRPAAHLRAVLSRRRVARSRFGRHRSRPRDHGAHRLALRRQRAGAQYA